MQKTPAKHPKMLVVGIKARTNNKAEMNPLTGKILPCVQKYFHEQLFDKIPNRKIPGTTICAYTDYESDHNGGYTYFIGEEVSSLDNIPEGFSTLTIPEQKYAKFTTEAGPMPKVCIDAWQKIWQMSAQDFGAPRRYHTDFEVYDERAKDQSNVVLDLFIGLND